MIEDEAEADMYMGIAYADEQRKEADS